MYGSIARPLWDHPDGVRSTDLAAVARMTKQSMGAIVDQLEDQGFVERVDDLDDKRAKLERLTKRGRELGRLTRTIVRRVEADWAKRIGRARLDALRDALEAALASLGIEA